jgi:hypothetical protein
VTTEVRTCSASLDEYPVSGLLQLTQMHGEFGNKTRNVWVRPSAISHFTEHEFWRNEGPRPRGSVVHMTNGETFQVVETPECIAASLR